MPSQLTAYRIFIASPGGLSEIRKTFKDMLTKYNAEDAMRRGVVFLPVGWEHTLGGMGRPQALINKDLDECDGFLMVLHDRWGSNAGNADGDTGTEEEYKRALSLLKSHDSHMGEIQVFFRSVDTERLSDPGPQLKKVLDFRSSLERERALLFHQFETTNDFEDLLRLLLASWVRGHENGSRKGQSRQEDSQTRSDIAGLAPSQSVQDAQAGDPASSLSRVEIAAALDQEGRVTEAEAIYAELAAPNDDATVLVQYGDFLWKHKRKGQAETIYRRAADTATTIGDKETNRGALLKLAHLLTKKGEFGAADAIIQSVCQSAADSGAYPDLAVALLRHGELVSEQGRSDEATKSYQAGLEALAFGDDQLTRADLLAALAQGCADRKDYDAAAGMYREALALKDNAGSLIDVGDLLVGLGSAEEMLGRPEKAVPLYERSIRLFEAEYELAGRADAFDHLGHALKETGDVERAIESYEVSAAVFESIQKYDSAADVFSSLGKLLLENGRKDEAASAFRQALAQVGRLKDRDEVKELYASLTMAIQAAAHP